MTTTPIAAGTLDVTVSLAPCPFCGKTRALEIIKGSDLMDEDQEFWEHQESFAVICSAKVPDGKGGCGACGGFDETPVGAISNWNMRANAVGKPTPDQGGRP